MAMKSNALRAAGMAFQAAAVGAALWYGWSFGIQIGGTAMGVVAAVNTALCVGLLADWLAEAVHKRIA
jgi:hypothetical protein